MIKELPYGFYVALVLVVVCLVVAIGNRIKAGQWNMGIGILATALMAVAMFVVFYAIDRLERASRRRKERREKMSER
jgi:hypothetical protein